MVKVTFEMEPEQVDAVVVQEMKSAIEGFEENLRDRSDGMGLAIFDQDPVKDIGYIQEYITAFKLVLDYYSVPGEM